MIITIRRAEKDDIPSIKKVLYDAGRLREPDWRGRYSIGGISYDDNELAEKITNDVYPYFVAVDDKSGETAGFMLCVEGTETILKPRKVTRMIKILDLCLIKPAVREKVDLMLLDQARELARERNCEKIIVDVPLPNM